jgi:predicted nucleic acid-binding protein
VFLLDTNIVSELRGTRPHGAVVAWIESVPATNPRLAAVTLGEIQRGVEITRERDAARACEIEAWADKIERTFSVLPLDSAVFRLNARLMRKRTNALYEDVLIAATALVNDMIVVTRNIDDFAGLDVRLLNPFAFRGPGD